eukprot:CAMPEP_0198726460 /NCGR_PEP_ID=MMETSP1475-20131203/3507_1 /TAXON_ID= ORGANISM="Unidentified sp., Strain CCMP1999" /NCGR_SAMPLE_ID=MMETSP1475 /ASSEMBLY_ACC=CAM_ASM_001111 /LENGTH=152 /DNA_ID=CAMNT_0044488383 /DNA_START=61 /DNA_END=520 /DNA_ORIENTATION=-
MLARLRLTWSILSGATFRAAEVAASGEAGMRSARSVLCSRLLSGRNKPPQLRSEELLFSTMRGSGPGGQAMQKSSNAVVWTGETWGPPSCKRLSAAGLVLRHHKDLLATVDNIALRSLGAQVVKHIPTGLTARCEDTRSLQRNRNLAISHLE